MLKTNNLSAEDAAVILELSPILDIAFVKAIGESERKFYIETKQGMKRLLRITPIKEYQWVKDDDRAYGYMATVGINVSRQISDGVFADGEFYYQLWTWIDGENLLCALPRMSHAEQFAVGVKFGEATRKIHSLTPMYDNHEPWGVLCRRNVQDKIQSYNNSPEKSRGTDLLVRYLQENMELLANRPTAFLTGNFNTSNLMVTPDNRIWFIDCAFYSGDPWIEFWEINGDDKYFNTGLIKGYFDGEPPVEYFPLLAFYRAMETLNWGYDPEIVLSWYDDMRNPVPNWYLSQSEPV